MRRQWRALNGPAASRLLPQLRNAEGPLLALIDALTAQISNFDHKIETLAEIKLSRTSSNRFTASGPSSI